MYMLLCGIYLKLNFIRGTNVLATKCVKLIV